MPIEDRRGRLEYIMVSRTAHSDWQERGDQFIWGEISSINSLRVSRLLPILALVHVVHLVIFWPYTPGAADNTHMWRNGIIAVHAAMLMGIVIYAPIKKWLENDPRVSQTTLVVMSELVALVYLVFGAALAIIDQRVTSNITPLLTASVGVAVAILMRPWMATLVYASFLGFFLTGVAWTQPNADLLLSVRVNGLTATALGLGLALLQWRNQVISTRQQQQIKDQQRELEEKNRELTLLASHDVLTGLLNRAQFTLEASRQITNTYRTSTIASLVMLDVDHFKSVNDTHGHPTGDSILVEVARTMKRTLRSADVLARFGGDEFAVLLPDTSLEAGLRVAESLRVAIEQHPFVIDAQLVRLTASFGVAQLSAEDGNPLDECYRAADKALYRAKDDGRNCVRFASQDDRL